MGLFCSRSGGCAGCTAKDQTILILADQVDYLRQQVTGNANHMSSAVAAASPAPEPLQYELKDSDELRITEEEEEIRFAQALGHITTAEAESQLNALAANS